MALFLGQVHTTPEKFENGVFALGTHQMFSVHATPEELENGIFTLLKNWLNGFRPHYTRGISQRNNHR